jgi:ATP-dependent protease ClpP protease subunit
MEGTTLNLTLRGSVRFDDEREPGIHRYPVEAALCRYRYAAYVAVDIESNGGCVECADAIFAALRGHPGYKITNARRACASAAMTILLAGDFRTAEPGTKFLAHQISTRDGAGQARWTASEHRAMARSLEKSNQKLVSHYAERTGRDARLFAGEIEHERPMTVQRARELGFIHCLAGQERWINGRPTYTGDEPLIQAMRGRGYAELQEAALHAAMMMGSPLTICHAAFTRKAMSK